MTEHETCIGFEVISGQYVPWCTCGWRGLGEDRLNNAYAAAGAHLNRERKKAS